MNYQADLRASVAAWLTAVAIDDIDSGREPMRYAQQPVIIATGRYVAIRLDVGFDNGRLLKMLDEATLNQLIPWDIGALHPQVYLDRKRVVVEAPLPMEAQEPEIELRTLTGSGHGGRVCLLGPNERGVTVSLPLSEMIHVLIGGTTGSGKTTTMRSWIYQFSGAHRIVLIDGKQGEGLGILNGVPGQVGPVAIDRANVLNALGWVYNEMNARYAQIQERGGRGWRDGDSETPQHILIFFDEFQEYRADTEVMSIFHSLAAQGRSARIHVIAGTQRPTVRMFGSDIGGATRAQFGVRIAHSVPDYKSSEAIIGGPEPRADYLMPRGDAYIIGSALRERVQIAYVPDNELHRLANGGAPELEQWPEFIGNGGRSVGRPAIEFDTVQIACAIHAARERWGRGRLQSLLEDEGVPISGSGPADRLLAQGQEIEEKLENLKGK